MGRVRGSGWLVAVVLVGCSGSNSTGSDETDDAATLNPTGDESGAASSGSPSTSGTTASTVGGSGDDTSADTTSGSGVDTSTGEPPATGTDSGGIVDYCGGFPAVADFGDAGPFETMQVGEGPDCTLFRPTTLGEDGRRHPVILWGNGTGTSPAIYAAALTHWASHGFIVAAANTANAGTGEEMLACLDWLTEQDADPASPYADKVDLDHVGTSGHSQGGGGALMAGQDPRVVATAPLQPYTQQGFGGYDQACQSNQNGPMFLMSGDADIIATPVPNQQRVFDDSNVPTLWGTLAGGNHIFTAIGNIHEYRAPATAWFRYHLMCDELARPVFYDRCELCSDPAWDVVTKNW